MRYLITLFLFCGVVLCQQYDDVVYLKDGSIIKGVIIEQSTNRYIKIKSGDNVFVYQMDEIDKMTKVISTQSKTSNIAYKTSWVSIGLDGTSNILGLGKDFKLSDGIYLSTGVGLGISWVNLGLKAEPKYNDSGFSLLASTGFFIHPWGDPIIPFLVSPSYQFRLGDSSAFFNLGITGGVLFNLGITDWLRDVYWEDLYSFLLPNLSFSFSLETL